MNKKLAIKGHATRGKEVIEILEMLGGVNKHDYIASCESLYFYTHRETEFIYFDWCFRVGEHTNLFTLEEFLEKYPYKVGDKVIAYAEGCLASFTIQDMRWNSELNKVEYKICSSWIDASLIMRHCKEESMRKKNNDNWEKWDLPDGYEFQDKECNVINTDIIKLVKKQPQYPKTYKECCELLSLGYKASLIQDFQKLLICRDAYWKIAGEQMGLDKPWEPDWNKSGQLKYVLICMENNIIKCAYAAINAILAFPTAEMRDAFYENFKDLIEECKELL